jgi:hypothetical protein
MLPTLPQVDLTRSHDHLRPFNRQRELVKSAIGVAEPRIQALSSTHAQKPTTAIAHRVLAPNPER